MDPVPEEVNADDLTEIHDGGYVEADNVNDEGMMEEIHVQPQPCPQQIQRPTGRYRIYVEVEQ